MMNRLFLIYSPEDIDIFYPKARPENKNSFFVFQTDLSKKQIRAIGTRGVVYREYDFLSLEERHQIDSRNIQMIRDLAEVSRDCVGYKNIPLVEILFHNLRYPCTAFSKLQVILPRLYEKVCPDEVCMVRRGGLICETTENILHPLLGERFKKRWTPEELFSALQKSSLSINLGYFIKGLRWILRKREKMTSWAALKREGRKILFANVSHEELKGVMGICSHEGYVSIMLGRRKSLAGRLDYVNVDSLLFDKIFRGWVHRINLKKMWTLYLQRKPEKNPARIQPLMKAVNYEIRKRRGEIVLNALCFEEILNKDIRVVFVWNDNLWWERMLVEVANQKGIPTFLFQHGVWSTQMREWWGPVTQRIGVWGPLAAEQIIQKGCSKDQIDVVGNPAYDTLSHERHHYMPKQKKDSSPGKNSKIKILFIGYPASWRAVYCAVLRFEEARDLFDLVLEAVGNMMDIELIVKVKGNDELALHQKWLRQHPVDCSVKIVREKSIWDLIAEAGMVISYYSTTALESMILNTPVIVIDLFDFPGGCIYLDRNVAHRAFDKKSLQESIQDILTPDSGAQKRMAERVQEFVREYACVGLGQANEKLTQSLINSDREKVQSV